MFLASDIMKFHQVGHCQPGCPRNTIAIKWRGAGQREKIIKTEQEEIVRMCNTSSRMQRQPIIHVSFRRRVIYWSCMGQSTFLCGGLWCLAAAEEGSAAIFDRLCVCILLAQQFHCDLRLGVNTLVRNRLHPCRTSKCQLPTAP